MSPHDLDRLLADTAFVRRLARSLVRDPDAADDLAQDALVVAMERPPRTGASPRGWIATVVRRLAIDRARASESRARRETAASRPEHAPAADEIAARLDASQRVAGALRELEEPYRTALYLRYVEDLEPARIAERLGLPVATVKTHLRRGLELLRRRFDREWGGRAAWSAALIPWTTPGAHAAPIAGTLFMSTTTKIAAALIVCGLAAWVLWPADRAMEPARGPDVAAVAEVAPGGLAVDASAPADAPRVALAPELATVPSATTGSGPYVRVLDERRFPVEGAHVELHVPGLGDDAATTDADGRAQFVRLPAVGSEKRAATVHAWDERGRAAADARSVKPVDASAEPDAVEKARSLGELVLGPAGSLAVRVESDGRPAPHARVRVQLGAMRRVELEAVADDAGSARFEHVPARVALVSASREGVAGRTGTVLAAGRETAVVVNLQPARDVAVRVVDAESKSPIPGARVEVHESYSVTGEADDFDAGMAGRTFQTHQPFAVDLPVDERGVARVRGLPAQGTYEVSARADGWVGSQPPKPNTRIPPDAREVVVELTSLHERAARWPLEPGEVAPPPDGTALTLRAETVAQYAFERYSPVPKRAWIENGAIRAEGVLDRIYGCYAIAPDGSLARLWIEDGKEVGHATSFRRPRRVDVRVLDAGGRAAPGVPLEIRNEGNNLLLPAVVSDADGRAAFEGLWGRRANVQSGHVELGAVDLELGDGRVEGRVPGSRELDVRLRIDGQPRLPPSYRIRAGGVTRVVAEDPATGVVRIAFETSGGEGLHVSAAGFLPASVPAISDTAEVVQFDLLRGGALLAHVEPPRAGRVRLRAESWNDAKQRWNTGSGHQIHDERFAPNAPDGAYLFGNLEPGRWRVRDVDAEIASDAVDVIGGAPPSEVALDLSGIVRVKGVVSVPGGMSVLESHVVVDGEAHAAHESNRLRGTERADGHFADKDGSFQLTVDATRPVTLRAAHPWLSPHPERGTAVVTGPTEDVRLELVAGDEVQIPVAPFGDTARRPSLRVYAYAGEPAGEPARWFRAPVVDGVARFGGLARGAWTLWIDPEHTHAPTVIPGVQVGAGVTRVDAQPAAGSSLRVRIQNAAGTAVPRIYVAVMRETEPTLLRSINSRGEDVVVLTGIAAGTYRTNFGTIGQRLLERTIEFDGRTDVEIEYDAR